MSLTTILRMLAARREHRRRMAEAEAALTRTRAYCIARDAQARSNRTRKGNDTRRARAGA